MLNESLDNSNQPILCENVSIGILSAKLFICMIGCPAIILATAPGNPNNEFIATSTIKSTTDTRSWVKFINFCSLISTSFKYSFRFPNAHGNVITTPVCDVKCFLLPITFGSTCTDAVVP